MVFGSSAVGAIIESFTSHNLRVNSHAMAFSFAWSLMKKLLLLMALFSSSAFAQTHPTLFEDMKACAAVAAKTTSYVTIAHDMSDEQISIYENMVQVDVNRITGDNAKKTLVFLAKVAWDNRKQDPVSVGLVVYDDCVKRMGVST